MRSDVLEVMAEEILGRPVGKLASFWAFDDGGRRHLDGMAQGRKWDLDREQQAFQRANKLELRKLGKRNTNRRYAAVYNETSKVWSKANRAYRTAYEKAYWAARKERLRELQRAKRARQKADPARWALVLARQARHAPKKRVRQAARYKAKRRAV